MFSGPNFRQQLSFSKDLVSYLKSSRLPFSATIVQKIVLQNPLHLVEGFDVPRRIQPNPYQKWIATQNDRYIFALAISRKQWDLTLKYDGSLVDHRPNNPDNLAFLSLHSLPFLHCPLLHFAPFLFPSAKTKSVKGSQRIIFYSLRLKITKFWRFTGVQGFYNDDQVPSGWIKDGPIVRVSAKTYL